MPIFNTLRLLGLLLASSLCGCSAAANLPFSAPQVPAAPARLSVLFVETAGIDIEKFRPSREAAIQELTLTFNIEVASQTLGLDLASLMQPIKRHDFADLRQLIRAKARQDYDIIFITIDQRTAPPLGYTGYAEGIGLALARRNSLAYGVLGSSLLQNKRIILHELGHLLGAAHSFSGYILFDSSLIRLADGFGVKSFNEIQRHIISRRPFRSPADAASALK